MLDRLVRRTVLAETDRVVRPDERDTGLHDRREPDGAAHVVGEHQERAAERAQQVRQRHAVERRAHGVLADAEVEDPAVRRLAVPERRGRRDDRADREERAAALDGGVVALRQVGAAPHELGEGSCDGLDDLAARLAGRHVLAGGELREDEVVGERPCDEAVEEGRPCGVGSAPRGVVVVPRRTVARASGRHLARVGQDVVGDGEAHGRVEAEQLLGGGHLVGAESGAVRLEGVAQVRGGPADHGLEPDERRALDRGGQRQDVDAAVGCDVDALHVPAVRRVARPDVLAEGDRRVVLDRDLVVVPDHREVAEALRARERGGLGGDALLEVAVGADHPDVVVERARAGRGVGVEQAALVALAHGHADGGRQTLAQRAGRGLDALRVMALGVPGGERAPGAERLEVGQLEAVAGQVELDVERERGVPARQHEPVAAQPVRVGGVVGEEPLEEQVGGGREAHRRARVAVAHLLHGVRCQHARGVDRAGVQGLDRTSVDRQRETLPTLDLGFGTVYGFERLLVEFTALEAAAGEEPGRLSPTWAARVPDDLRGACP